MRLTDKNKIKELATLQKNNVLMTDNNYKELKLGQLENIEDELGIDLKVFHKLMDILYCNEPGEPNSLYVKDKDMIIPVGILEIDYCKKKIIFYKDSSYNDDYIYNFFQYGKTWALTEDELICD
ncbi:hypothetical protein [Intestinibacter sp.]|uniref:hypothetical protein n=1 Tax=Intestinibacter sp. TaxID=1965304 RepID=UPI002A74F2DB|nr:hypothetical protein [Intestinibacter sp.]MDY2736897.1 hypothetical protein [Intestinibacter sp.]